MIYPFPSIWHLSSWFPVGTCSLCGQAIAIAVEIIDGSQYVFDTYSCVAMFKKFQLYGEGFTCAVSGQYLCYLII